ncbi:MAG: hypothetical protein ACOX1P_16535 [Thermoguttaceae bacterium]|jgi:hypothetical protein
MTTPTIDRCTVQVIDEVLGDHRSFMLPETVAEAEANCYEVQAAKFFIKWFMAGDDAFVFNDEDRLGEPIAVSIIERPQMITIRWFATGAGSAADAVERRKQIASGEWLRREVEDED